MQTEIMKPLSSLPKFLKALTEGTKEERAALILGLHRRMYHKEAGEMRKLLHAAGVPMHVLATVEDALVGCEICRNFQQTSAKPLSKLSTALTFNDTAYFDLVFFDTVILFVGVDEAIRWTVIKPAEFKDYHSLESAYRRSWISQYGPVRKFRSDRESVFNSETFASYTASVGTTLELITAEDQHTWMGILDRRVQLLRRMYPRLMQELSNDRMYIDHEDVASECQIAMNTLMSLGGQTPYTMLYGCLPMPLFAEDSEFILPQGSYNLFYEHQLIRTKAIACFHQALIEERIQRNLKGRTRNAHQLTYKPGMHVDFWKKTEKKQLQGWRGPAIVLGLVGEGYITLRWQSHVYDIPVNHVRPHINRIPIAISSNPVNASVPVPAKKQEFIEDKPTDEVKDKAEQKEQSSDAFFMIEAYERYWNIAATDHYQVDDAMQTLISVTSYMPLNSCIVHGISIKNEVV
jgi:hypothetical protein